MAAPQLFLYEIMEYHHEVKAINIIHFPQSRRFHSFIVNVDTGKE